MVVGGRSIHCGRNVDGDSQRSLKASMELLVTPMLVYLGLSLLKLLLVGVALAKSAPWIVALAKSAPMWRRFSGARAQLEER